MNRPILSLGATVIVSILLGLCVLALATALLMTAHTASQQFGVAEQTICGIKAGRNWAHVQAPPPSF